MAGSSVQPKLQAVDQQLLLHKFKPANATRLIKSIHKILYLVANGCFCFHFRGHQLDLKPHGKSTNHTQKQTVEHMERRHACMLCTGKGIMERGYAVAWGKY